MEAAGTPLPSFLPELSDVERSSSSPGLRIWLPERKAAGQGAPGSTAGAPRGPRAGGRQQRRTRTTTDPTAQRQESDGDTQSPSRPSRRSNMPLVPVSGPRLPSTAEAGAYRGGRHYPSRVPSYEASYASIASRGRASTAPQRHQQPPTSSSWAGASPSSLQQHRTSTSSLPHPGRRAPDSRAGTHHPPGTSDAQPFATPRRGGYLHQRGVRMPVLSPSEDLQSGSLSAENSEAGPPKDRPRKTTDTRLDHLPMVVCHTANNNVILLEMRDVQNRKLRRKFGRAGQKQARDVMYSLMNSPDAVAERKWQEGYMDVGQISRELCAEDMKIAGEDGDWETWHLNQDMYQKFKEQAPEYVEAKFQSIKHSDGSKIDFEHWMMLRALAKETPSPPDRNAMARQQLKGKSWAAPRTKGQASSMRMLTTEQRKNSNSKVVYGRTAVVDNSRANPAKNGGVKFIEPQELHREASDLGLDPLNVSYTFDGEKMKLDKSRNPSPNKSGAGIRSTTVNVLRPEEAEVELDLDEEMRKKELKALITSISMASSQGNVASEEQLRSAELAEKQFNRLQRWDLQKAGRAPQVRMKSGRARSEDSRPRSSGAKNRGTSSRLSSKVKERLAHRNRQLLVQTLTRADQTSLVNGAREREQHRQEVQDVWDKKRQAKRPGTVPVPTPKELPDEELIKLHTQRALKDAIKQPKVKGELEPHLHEVVRAAKEKAEHEAFVQQKLREFEELERAVEAHEDFVFSGSVGKVSVKADELRKLYNKVCEINSLAYDEVEAGEAEDLYRQKAEAMRLNEAKAEATPYDETVQGRFKFSLEELHAARPYFKAPAPNELREKYERRPWSLQMGEQKYEKPVWTMQKSIFWRRRNESDSKECYDSDKLLDQQGELDWRRVTAKKRFVKLIRMVDSEVADGEQSVVQELDEVHEVMMRNFISIRSAFYYFRARGTQIGEACFSMRANSWITFCREVGITDPLSPTCNASAINAMFVATNYEDQEAMSKREQEENDDNALMRFEWLEALVRVAIAKFIQDKRITEDVSQAVEFLCRYHLDTMPPEATLDPNVFRRNRLYNKECDSILKENSRLFEAVFNCYKAKNSSKYFWMEHWFALLENLNLIGERTNIGHTQAKLVFMWSMMGSIDELKRRQKVVSWQFLDFLEGLSRMAEALALPTKEELDYEGSESSYLKYQYEGMYRQWEIFNKLSPSVLRRKQRPSFGIIKELGSSSTRTLAEKLSCFIGFMVAGLCERWNVPVGNVERLTSKLNAMSVMLGGGIELA